MTSLIGSKTYRFTPAISSYGARIWIDRDTDLNVAATLALLSRWGGSDKHIDSWDLYEFSPECASKAIGYLELLGFMRES